MASLALGKILDTHKSLVRAPSVGIRRGKNGLLITSVAQSGLTLWSRIEAGGEPLDATVDTASFAALVKSDNEALLELRDGRLHVKCGRIKGDIPSQTEEQPRHPKFEGVTISANDVKWLCENLPKVTVSDLNRTGLLSVECDGKEWRVSCADDIHGACMFSAGASKIKFSLAPSDADSFRALLNLANGGEVLIGFREPMLIIKAGDHSGIIPTVTGKAQTREVVTSGIQLVAKFSAPVFQEALSVLKPVASAKDAKPISVKLQDKGILLSVTSPAGSVENFVPARIDTKTRGILGLEFRLSFPLTTSLVSRAFEETSLLVRFEKNAKGEAEVARINLRCGPKDSELHLVMLTAM